MAHRSSIGCIRPAIVLSSSLPQRTRANTTPPPASPPAYHLNYRTTQPLPPHTVTSPSRSPLEHHPAVTSRLSLYYRTLLLTRDGLLSFDEYCSFYLRLSKVLLAPHFSLSLARSNAQSDWDRDMSLSVRGGSAGSAGSGGLMDCDSFCHSLFEVMSAFVLLHDAAQLVFMLNKTYTLLTQHASGSGSQSIVTFAPLTSIDAHTAFNAHTQHNAAYNSYTHTAAHSLQHQVHDAEVEFTVPLLPPLSVDPSPGVLSGGGLKQGPTRNGLCCSIGAMDEYITLYSPYAAMLPAQWSVAKWQRDNRAKLSAAQQTTAEEEKQSTAKDEHKQQQSSAARRGSSGSEEPFVVRERRERSASRSHSVQTVTLLAGRTSGNSSRRGSVVMDVDEAAVDGAKTSSGVQQQRDSESAVRRFSRYLYSSQ